MEEIQECPVSDDSSSVTSDSPPSFLMVPTVQRDEERTDPKHIHDANAKQTDLSRRRRVFFPSLDEDEEEEENSYSKECMILFLILAGIAIFSTIIGSIIFGTLCGMKNICVMDYFLSPLPDVAEYKEIKLHMFVREEEVLHEGGRIHRNCSIIGGDAGRWSYFWKTPNGSDFQTSFLDVENLQSNDYGWYYCIANSTDGLSKRIGFSIYPRSFLCGDKVHDNSSESGRIYSHRQYHENKNYYNRMNCIWSLKTEKDNVIYIFYSFISLQDSKDCSKDNVIIYDGEDSSSTILDKLCGHNDDELNDKGLTHVKRTHIYSSGEKITVRFSTDDSVTDKGFILSYKFILRRDFHCGSNVYYVDKSIGRIASHQQYRKKKYSNHMQCRWVIQAKKGNVIHLVFRDFSIQESVNCEQDRVAIYEGEDRSGPNIGIFCGKLDLKKTKSSGTTLNEKYHFYSSGSTMTVYFSSDSSGNGKGFRLKYTFVSKKLTCIKSQILNATKGIIISHEKVSRRRYRSFQNCEWKIIGIPRKRIRLTFKYFHLKQCSNCSCDKLTVYDGTYSTNLCTMIQTSFVSRGQNLTLRFKCGAARYGKGFQISYDSNQ